VPVIAVMIIPADASEMAMLIPSSSPIITCFLMVKLLYRFCIGVGW
jgi:hypothetical protein